MTIGFGTSLAFDSSRNPRIGNFYRRPSAPSAGTIIFNVADRELQGWNGTSWVSLTTSGTEVGQAWGNGGVGQLGENVPPTNRNSPVSVVGFTDWTQFAAGEQHSLGVRPNGTLWAWGFNYAGLLGINADITASRSSPVSVLGGFTDWISVGAGRYHSLGIRSSGGMWAWGNGNSGKLGNNSTVTASSPVSVVGGFTDWIMVEAADQHTVAIRSNGTAWSWGSSSTGQVGSGVFAYISSPVSVLGGFTDWIHVSCGREHTVGVRRAGSMWAWGNGNYGQQGSNNVTAVTSPVSVVGGFTDWILSASWRYGSAGLRSNGTIWTWGRGTVGQLGDNQTLVLRSSPVSIVGGFTDWVFVNSGREHLAAIRAGGSLWAWGRNSNQQLGNASSLDASSPVSVVGGFTDWVSVVPGGNFTLAIRST